MSDEQSNQTDPIQESVEDTMGSSKIIIIIVVLIIVAAVVVFARQGSVEDTDAPQEESSANTETPTPPPPPPEPLDSETVDETVVFDGDESEPVILDITGRNFAFSMGEIRVKKGDIVRINFSSADGLHDWVVDEFSASTERVNTGEASIVVFTPDKSGTFEYYCSVGNHRQLGMVGNLIVE